VDLFEVKGGSEHQYAFHGDGEAFAAKGLAFQPLDAKELGDPATGYRFMEKAEQASTEDTISCRWISNPDTGLGVRLRMLGAPGTRLVHAEANGLRNRKTPFAKVRMHPILVRRQGPENRFLAVIDAVKGTATSTAAIRRLEARTSAGWADALEIRTGDRTDVVVFASREAAKAGVAVPEHPGVSFHSRLGYASFRAGVADHLWVLGGTQAAAGELALACPPAVSCRLVQATDGTIVIDQPLPPGLRADGQHLFVTGRSNGAYRLAGATGTTLRLADDPILDVSPGDSATIVPWASIARVSPHAFRLLGDLQAVQLPADGNRRRFLRPTPQRRRSSKSGMTGAPC
jgi:hypothetical protein